MSVPVLSPGATRFARALRGVLVLAAWLACAGAANAQSIFSWTASTASVNENAGSVTLTVQRIGLTSVAASVTVSTSDITATAGSDYTALSTNVNFAANQTTANVTVTILDDALLEGPETFSVGISTVSTLDSTTTPAVCTVTINDDESLIRFVSATTNIFENAAGNNGPLGLNPVSLNFERVYGSVGAVSVQVEIQIGRAHV